VIVNFGQIFLSYRSSPNFGITYFLPQWKLCTNLDIERVGLHFGRFYNKRIWSPWPSGASFERFHETVKLWLEWLPSALMKKNWKSHFFHDAIFSLFSSAKFWTPQNINSSTYLPSIEIGVVQLRVARWYLSNPISQFG
jgi:hypothetical protein